MKKTARIALVLVASSLFAGSAAAQSAMNWNSLKLDGEANPRPWCGQWWGHRCNGTAINSKNNKTSTYSCGYEDAKSPVEKLDALMGRANKIEYAKLDKWLTCSLAAWSDCQSKSGQDRSTCLKDSAKQTKYGRCQKGFKVDTAYEHEIVNHGQGAYGWDSWWGHCNAWGAAAVLYAEPTKAVTAGGQSFTVADVKGLLTEALMDVDLAADGWFGCRYDGPGATRLGSSCANENEAYQDVTPRQLLGAFSKHIGTDRHGVVIDRHTEWEVWNQPLWKYSVTGCRDSADAGLCGTGVVKKTCNLSFTWAEDGVGHGEVCTPPNGYTERSLAFSVCVKDGNVLGDRKNQRWEVTDAIARSERWPDFIWVPGNLSSVADSGNPYVHSAFDKIIGLAQQSAGAVTPPNPGGAAKNFKVAVGQAITDQGVALTRPIVVADNVVVKGVALCLDVDHAYRGDLVVKLTSPQGVSETVWDKSGGGEDNIKDCRDATNAAFYGKPSKGTWKVSVQDVAKGDAGKWNSATLKLIQ